MAVVAAVVAAGRVAAGLVGNRVAIVVFCAGGGGVECAADDLLAMRKFTIGR